MAVFVGRSSMMLSKRTVSDPNRKQMPSVNDTGPRTRSPATHVPFLLPRSSIEASRPSTLSRACWRDTVGIDLNRASAVATDYRLAGWYFN
jgi:hypothetical protein